MPENPVVDRHLGAFLRDELGGDGGEVALDPLGEVPDPLPTVELDLRRIGALQQIAEDLDELLALGLGERPPVLGHGPARGLLEVEDLVRDLPHRATALRRAAFPLEGGVLEGPEHPVDRAPELLGGTRARRPAGRRPGEARGQTYPPQDERASTGDADRFTRTGRYSPSPPCIEYRRPDRCSRERAAGRRHYSR